jgi:hypothetical protein
MNGAGQRQLPTVKIHDTDFYVDLKGLEFRQVDNPNNAISFRNVQDNGDHTSVMYDPKTKNAFQGTWHEMSQGEDVKLIRLPAMINLDREALIGQLNQLSWDAHLKRQQSKNKDQIESPKEPKEKRRRRGRGI